MKNPIMTDNWRSVSLADAETLTANWQEDYTIKAFLFHRNELECIITTALCEKARFYIGLNGPGMEMLIVGVDGDGKDIIDEFGENSGVYNFALPCPSTCDLESPLFHGDQSYRVKKNMLVENYTRKTCIESLQEISFQDAFDWTLAWQVTHQVKSFLFELDEMIQLMESLNCSRVRIYFGNNSEHEIFAIMIGVNEQGDDVVASSLPVNGSTPCDTSNSSNTNCDESSPLYHNV